MADSGPTAHAMVRVRPQHWQAVLPDFRLGWAEGSRAGLSEQPGIAGSGRPGAGGLRQPVR